jgi:AraC-like DNA-binding protein
LDKRKQRLQKIFTYVEQNFDKEIPIDEVAGLIGLSIPSFCNFFKTATQSTFTDFVNRYRIQKACLLLHEDKTIAETSFATGFNNVTYFNKVFKNIVHKTPSEFRNATM